MTQSEGLEQGQGLFPLLSNINTIFYNLKGIDGGRKSWGGEYEKWEGQKVIGNIYQIGYIHKYNKWKFITDLY